jgi:hypothetical protein
MRRSKRFDMNKKSIKKEKDSLMVKITDVSPLADWDRLFKEAKKNGFNAEKDKKGILQIGIQL